MFMIEWVEAFTLKNQLKDPLAQSGESLTANQGVAGSSQGPATYFFVEIYHEIISTFNFPLPLNQEGQMSVSGESMCTKVMVNR